MLGVKTPAKVLREPPEGFLDPSNYVTARTLVMVVSILCTQGEAKTWRLAWSNRLLCLRPSPITPGP